MKYILSNTMRDIFKQIAEEKGISVTFRKIPKVAFFSIAEIDLTPKELREAIEPLWAPYEEDVTITEGTPLSYKLIIETRQANPFIILAEK